MSFVITWLMGTNLRFDVPWSVGTSMLVMKIIIVGEMLAAMLNVDRRIK